jgi:hypothetical protein
VVDSVNQGELRVIVTLPSGKGAVLYFSPIRFSDPPQTLAHPTRFACLAAVIAELQAAGATSLRAIAAGFNERGIRTPRGTNCWRGWPNRPRPPSYHLSRSMTVTVRTQ